MMNLKRYLWMLSIAVLLGGCAKKDAPVQTEKVLRHPLLVKIKSLDPGNVEDVYGMQVLSNICESLYTYHYLKRPFEVEPMLADGMPQISENKLMYTIRIKQGVRFQDDPCFEGGKGRELKAADFVFAFKRIANIRYASPNWGGFNDRIVGLDAFREYTKQFTNEFEVDYSKEVEGLKALDDYTLQIKLVKPWPQFVDDLTTAVTAPLPREAVDRYQKEMIYHPVGTGPYFVSQWHKGVFIELVKNPNFRQEAYPEQGAPGDAQAGFLEAAGKRLPFVDRIIFRIIEEEQPRWFLFMRGETDLSGIPKDNFNAAVDLNSLRPTKEMQHRGIELDIYDQPSLFFLGFNMQDPVLGKNKPLRQAISYAINKEEVNLLFYNGRWRVAHSLIHPVLNEYDPSLARADYNRYDPQEARRLLKEAEQIHGGPIPLLTLGATGESTQSRQMNLFFQRQIAAIGLKVKVDATDWPTYMEKTNKGQMQIFAGGGVRFNTPDALGALAMFATKYFAPQGNYFFYSDPEYDRLFDQAEVTFPGPERTALYRRMERMVLEDYPAVFTNHRVEYTMRHDWVENFKPHPFLYGYLKYIDIDTEKQKTYKKRVGELRREKE